MPEGFFSEVFKAGAQAKVEKPPNAGTPKEAKPETPKAPAAPAASSLEARLAELERQLTAEHEQVLSYEIRFQEMKNAQSSVEEMFQKMWAKASKEKLEEELRVVREKSMARSEVLEKRLDEFQKGLLDMVNSLGSRSSQIKEEVRKELAGHLEELGVQSARKLENDITMKIETMVEVHLAAISQRLKAGTEVHLAQFKDEFIAKSQEIVSSRLTAMKDVESAQAMQAVKMAEMGKIWSMLLGDFKELATTVAAMKGTLESIENSVTSRTHRELEEQVEILSNQWTGRISALEARMAAEAQKHHTEALRELREGWTRELAPAKESLIIELRNTLEWQQMKSLWQKVEEISKGLIQFQETSNLARSAMHRDVTALANEVEINRGQFRHFNQNLRQLEETVRLVLEMLREKKDV